MSESISLYISSRTWLRYFCRLINIVTGLRLVLLGSLIALSCPAEDMADLKAKAEAGDMKAQFEMAETFQRRGNQLKAFRLYKKLASQGDRESRWRMAGMLFNGYGIPADPAQGVFIIYQFATNSFWPAYHMMYDAYRNGKGVEKDMVQAYAWLQLSFDTATGYAKSRSELDQLAFEVDVATSQTGKRLGAEYRSGKWPPIVIKPNTSFSTTPVGTAPAGPPVEVKLDGIAMGANPTASVNGKVVKVGETVVVPAKPQDHTIKCLKITPDSVLVSVDDESPPRELRLK